jgi:hypothetical protein
MIARKKNPVDPPKKVEDNEAPVGNIALEQIDIIADKSTGKKYMYYDNLSKEEKKLFSQDSPIGRFIRSKAMHGKGPDAASVAEFATALPKAALNAIGQTSAVPQAAMVEAIAYATGKPANLANALPNYDSFNTSQRTPSQVFMSPDASPIAKLAVDIVADPSNLAGGFGLLKGAKVMNSLGKAASKVSKKFDEVAFGITDDLMDIGTAKSVAKNIDPEMPFSAKTDSQKVVHVLTDDGEVYEDVTSRADLYDSTEEIQPLVDGLPKEVTIDGNTFKLRNNPDEGLAATQATFAKQYNERIGSLPAEETITTDRALLEISNNKDGTDRVIQNIKNLEDVGVTEQKSSGVDRFLTSFYQTSSGNRAVNTKKGEAYVGLSDYLKDKLNSVIMKQPKSAKEYKFFSGRKKFYDIVDVYDESGSVLRSDVSLSSVKPGDIISFKTILSGSLDKDKAAQFGDYLMEALIPEGTSTMSVNVLRDIKSKEFAGLMSELENLLYKDAKFKVLKSNTTIKGSDGYGNSGFKVQLMNPKVLIPAFVTLKLNQSRDEGEE